MSAVNERASTERRKSERPLRLSFGSTQKVEVIAEDKYRFCTAVSEAAKACQWESDASHWVEQFKDFLIELNGWCSKRSDAIAACFVAWGEGGLTVYAITRSDDYQFELDDDLHSLDLHLAKVYPDCPAEVLQIPNGPEEELSSYFSPEKSVQAYGDEQPAS